MPSYIRLMFPVAAAVWVFSLSSVLYSLASRRAVYRTLLLAALRVCRFLLLGVRLYSKGVARLASVTGDILVDLASNQPCDFGLFFPRVAKAMRCMVSGRISHFFGRVSWLRGAYFLGHCKLFHY